MQSPSVRASREEDAEVLHRLMAARLSCRAYLKDPVPQDLIENILSTGQLTASWNNVQPWHVHITRGQGTDRFRAMISAKAKEQATPTPDLPFPREYAGVYLERRRACGFALYNAVGIARGDKEGYARQTFRNFELFDAPHVAIITTEEALGVYGAVDCGGYIANFMLAAQAHGVATIAQGALAMYSADIRSFLKLPASRQVVCGISFGWPDLEHPTSKYRTDRAAIADAVTWTDD
jgi:nitroreductase